MLKVSSTPSPLLQASDLNSDNFTLSGPFLQEGIHTAVCASAFKFSSLENGEE